MPLPWILGLCTFEGSEMGISKDGRSKDGTCVALGKVVRDFLHFSVAAGCLRNSLTPLDRQGILRESFQR